MIRGTSGARKGFKIFSFNTTIRNPKRNLDFLRVFEKFNDTLMDDVSLYNYFFQLVQEGVYQFSNIPLYVKQKLENNEDLTLDEVRHLIENNPQATGINGRVMTQLRALKDQGFLIFKPGSNRKNIIQLSELGKELIQNSADGSIVYTKAMLATHAQNPVRKNMENQSVPFLNTVFVINKVNEMWTELGNKAKGILLHEFGAFVLSMKNCDYNKAADEIIKYRSKFKYKINMDYIYQYLSQNDVLPFKRDSIIRDYPDEVFRKFEMTGLIVSRGKFSYRYVDFSKINIDKINVILESFKDYKFKEFPTQEEYYNYMASIKIPWEKDEALRKQIVKTKYKILGLKYNPVDNLISQEEYVDVLLRNQALKKAVQNVNIDSLKKELSILSGRISEKSQFDDLAEPLRLEYLLALILGKVYGTEGLISNIIYDEEGKPLHYAPAGKSDILLYREEGSYIFEPTMQRSRTQLLNSETTNILRHVRAEQLKTNLDYRVMMIAPTVHIDIAEFFLFNIEKKEAMIIPTTIDKATNMFLENDTIVSLNKDFDNEVNNIRSMNMSEFVDLMNSHRINTA